MQSRLNSAAFVKKGSVPPLVAVESHNDEQLELSLGRWLNLNMHEN